MTMVMNTLPKNLLFSLPDVLVSTVYEYDTTHRHFYRDPKFVASLQVAYMKLNKVKEKCIQEVTYYFEELIESGNWCNEYGYIGENDGGVNQKQYNSSDDFIVATHLYGPVLFYKVLPKTATKENCSYLRKPRKFDGFFMHSQISDAYYEYLNPEKYCLSDDVNYIGMNSNKEIVWMYF